MAIKVFPDGSFEASTIEEAIGLSKALRNGSQVIAKPKAPVRRTTAAVDPRIITLLEQIQSSPSGISSRKLSRALDVKGRALGSLKLVVKGQATRLGIPLEEIISASGPIGEKTWKGGPRLGEFLIALRS